jgi:hypothetical protein
MADGEALPGDIGADQRGVDMHDLALRDAGRDAGLDRALVDAPESLGAPALANPGQRRMVGQPVVKARTSKPPDVEVHPRLAHQPTVMDDAEQEAGQHEPHRRLGIDGGTADPGRVDLRQLVMQPAEVENPVDALEDVIVGDKIAQRAADKKLQLPAPPPLQHPPVPPRPPIRASNQGDGRFSTAPASTSSARPSHMPGRTGGACSLLEAAARQTQVRQKIFQVNDSIMAGSAIL